MFIWQDQRGHFHCIWCDFIWIAVVCLFVVFVRYFCALFVWWGWRSCLPAKCNVSPLLHCRLYTRVVCLSPYADVFVPYTRMPIPGFWIEKGTTLAKRLQTTDLTKRARIPSASMAETLGTALMALVAMGCALQIRLRRTTRQYGTPVGGSSKRR